MLLNFFQAESVEIIRTAPGTEDRFGNPVKIESLISSSGILGFRGTNEQKPAVGSSSLDEYKIVFSDDVEILPGDRFRVRGEEWIQDGSPISVTPAFWSAFLPFGKIVNVKKVVRNG